MYPVSDEYIAARRAPVKEERITGGIKLKDGTIIEVNDSVIIQGSLSISRDVCGSKWDIGTMNYSKMQLRIRDESAYDHEFGGALIKLTYGIVTAVAEDGTKTWENVPLPPYFVDGSQTTRKRNMVKLTAYDPIKLLDINYPDTIPTTSLYAALQYVCNRAGLGLATTEEEFNALPNADVIPDFSSESVETCRDVAMWIAQTVNCSGFCDYRGLLKLKPFKYEGGNVYDRKFTEHERITIEYSDTKTYLAYLQSYCGKEVKQYSMVFTWTGSDAPHIKEGAANLPKNPILQKLTSEQHDAVNQSYLLNRSAPTRYIKATAFVDPALEPLDVVAFTGGNIDIGQIINVATRINWKYRGKGTICCANVDEYSETASASSTALSLDTYTSALDAANGTEEEDELIRIEPQSQIVKRLNALENSASSGGVGMKSPLDETSEIFNCYDGRNVAGTSGNSCYASVIGLNNEASGFCSFAMGTGCKATGYECFCGGYGSEANGTGNIVFGSECVSSGYNSAVFGDKCTATYADDSLVSGYNSSTTKRGSFIHGYNCKAEQNSWTTVLGMNCASKYGEASLVSGEYLVGSEVTGSAIFGCYNADNLSNVIFAVGNGNSLDNRSNALTLDKNGNLTISGTLTCAGVVQENNAVSASLLSESAEDIPIYTVQSDNVVTFGGITYTFTAAETGEYTGVTTSTGKSMSASIPSGIGNTQTHNAAFMALAMMSLK